jgi:putative transposase
VTEPVSGSAAPRNKLTADEERQVLATLNGNRFVDKPPKQIYATLLAEGQYLCSISTMYRVLAKNAQVKDRHRQADPPGPSDPGTAGHRTQAGL